MDWQQILVFLIVAGAALYLVWRQRARRSACGGCAACPGSAPADVKPETAAGPQLVQLELTPRRIRRPGT